MIEKVHLILLYILYFAHILLELLVLCHIPPEIICVLITKVKCCHWLQNIRNLKP